MKSIETLVGRTLTMVELDNEMERLGYISEGDVIKDIEVVESGCIAYTKDGGEDYDIIDFEVVREDLFVEDSEIKVTGIR